MGVLLRVPREPGLYPLCSHFTRCGFFFNHRIRARERMGTKASHLLSKRKEGRERALKQGTDGKI